MSTLPPSLSLDQPSTPLSNQVAGHQGVMSDASGSLVIKPALAREIAFYQLIAESPRSGPLAKLRPFIPKFFGTLRLEGRLKDGQLNDDIPEKNEVPESVVLQNLSYGFTNPSILDAKLGTVLHEPTAAQEKKEKMEKQAKETTTRETGLRLTGCQTWHGPSQSYILTPKSFGKSISKSDLPTGMMRFFPTPSDIIPSLITPPIPTSTSTTSSTNQTLSTATSFSTIPASQTLIPPGDDQTSSSSLSGPQPIVLAPLSTEYTNHAIPPNLLVRVLDIIDKELEKLERVLKELEIRFVGGSVLIVYESDPDRLSAALERIDNRPPQFIDDDVDVIRQNGGEGEDDDEDDLEDLLSDEDSEEDDSEDEDGRKEDERVKRRCPPVVLKMIDFAHTWLADGEGPDEGVLLGLETLRGLIQGRESQVREAMRST